MQKLRFQAFGVGCAKTGTKSLAGMLRGHYRSEHEPQAHALIELILKQEQLSEFAFRDSVRRTIAPLGLEMNASQLNGHIADALVSLFPEAKFVLTLREPGAWVRSFVNHQLEHRNIKPGSAWARFRDLRFLGAADGDARAAAGDAGLYTIDQYLRYWTTHNSRIIQSIPPRRLLIVRTENLTQDIPRLAAFLGIPETTITPARLNAGSYAVDAGAVIDDEVLAVAARRHAALFREATGINVQDVPAAGRG